MTLFWSVFLGALAALALFSVVMVAAMPFIDKWLINLTMDRVMKSLVDTRYSVNLGNALSLIRRGRPQVFLENMIRATKPSAIERPMGTPLQLSHWEHLMFSPAQVQKLPTPSRSRLDTTVVIGPGADKPLKCDIPILIAGMSYGGALSADTKVALARGASQAGTATNTGENYLPAEREAADRLIVQYHRGTWPLSSQNHPEWLDTADAIEIQIGQGAQAGAEMKTSAQRISAEMRNTMGLEEGDDAVISARLRGVDTPDDLVELVRRLKKRYRVPVGIKFAVGAHLREDLELLIPAGPDFIVLDGGEGGTHAGPPILQDDFGLPLIAALPWADQVLRDHGVRHDVSLIASGGLTTPGQFLKAIALGADAVYIGFAALMAMATSQMRTVLPWAPPEAVFYESGTQKHALDTVQAAENLTNYLKSCNQELEMALQSLGYARLDQVDKRDLFALDPWTAAITGVSPIGPQGPGWMPER
ncbi:MAG: FMN-binding glutamate synthase family protein, partial [Clostridia bacterium]